MANNDMRIPKPNTKFDPLSMGLLIAFFILAMATAVIAFVVVRNFVQSWTMTDLPGVPIESNSSEIVIDSQGVPMTEPLQPAGGLEAVPWDGKSRVTALIMGLDLRDWEEAPGSASRSDTMILLTLDPISMEAGMLNIPRDLWVNIPGYGHGKINTAYFLGEVNNLPGGGPGLAVETVEQFIGVPINYYAQIDFSTFVRFVDEINGVKITIGEDGMRLDPIGPQNDVFLQPGRYVLNGDLALAYARNRYTAGGDFDRAKRTQEVIMAIRDRILEGDGYLSEMISKAPQLYMILKDGIRTNMTLGEAVKLALLAQKIDPNDIKMVTIPPDVLIESTSPDGLSIYIPIPDEIRMLRDKVFTSGVPIGPYAVAEDPKVLMQTEQPRVRILNGTSVAGLATQTSEYLRSEGMNVVEEATADQIYEESMMYIYTGKPYSAGYIADLMDIKTGRIFNQFNPDSPIDIAIIVGNDWAYDNPMP
jgi:polyisoprenyl-teichoic acid--peptidoglycan teichoic acid transferase